MSSVQVFVALALLFIAIIGHVVTTVWWASAITTTLRFMADELKRIGKQLADHDGKFYEKDEAKEQVAKRDKEVEALRDEISVMRDRVSALEGGRVHGQRGEIATATVVVIAVLSVILAPLILKTGNPFDRSADPANRRSASAMSGRDIVDITKAVAASEEPVTVHVDRSVTASAEVTDPKLTVGQRVGRFFSGLGTWALILLVAALGLGLVTPAGLLAWSRHKYRSAFKNTIAAVRDLDEDTYQKVVPKLAARQDRRDKVLVDKVKSELH